MTCGTPAARLCAACGMCCNGVLFYSVVLQPADAARKLAVLGLKVKRRRNEQQILQPCPAHQGSSCAIYDQRPERCRIFACRQLRAVEAGEISEAAALEKILEARRLAERVRGLFRAAGDVRENKAFVVRYETLFTAPLDLSPEAVALRQELRAAMRELEDLLAKDFRVQDAQNPEFLGSLGLGIPAPEHSSRSRDVGT
jgi:hypothetical protein